MAKEVIELAGVITENEEMIRYVEEHKGEEEINMCEATKQWEEKIINEVIDMMGVQKEGEQLSAKEAIERLKTEGEVKGKTEEKKAIAEKMKEKGYSIQEIQELTGILLH